MDVFFRRCITIESQKMQKLRSTYIPADIREMYVVLQPVCLQHMTKTAWMLYGILENRIYFLRCGFVEETTDKYQLQEIIRAEVPNSIDKIIWVYEDFPKCMLQNTFHSGNKSQVRLIKKMCGMTRKVAKKFEALKNSQIETQDFQDWIS